MNEQEVSKYLQKIKEEEISHKGAEGEIVKAFRDTGGEIQSVTGKIQKLQEEQNRLRMKFVELSSKMDAYTGLLIMSETKRLDEKNDKRKF